MYFIITKFCYRVFLMIGIVILFASFAVIYSAEKTDEKEILLKAIQEADAMKFKTLVFEGKTYEYKVYKAPICLSKNKTVLPIEYDVSPLYSLAVIISLIESETLYIVKQFDAYFSFWRDKEGEWFGLCESFREEYPEFDKSNFGKIIKKELNDMYCIGEVKHNNVTVLVSFSENRTPNPFEPEKGDIITRNFWYDGTYFENNRYFFFETSDTNKNKELFYELRLLVEESSVAKLRREFVYDNPYFKKPDPPPKETWHRWETHLKDYSVEAEFVYYDGQFVTIMKRDGTKEKIKYQRLCYGDKLYVDKEMADQKKRYEQELKDLPKKIKESLREWITKIHDYKVKGEFVDYDGKFVTIKKEDGQIEKIEYSRLCLDDKNYVQEKMLQKKRNNRKILK